VPFKVETSDHQGGRRAVEHIFPGKDEPFYEDLGRAPRRFSVEGFVLGDDYLTQRDNLLFALEKLGSGLLVHPYYGNRTVQLASPFSVRESTQEGRMARITMDFAETEAPTNPTPDASPTEQIEDKAETAKASAKSAFEEDFSVDGLPSFFRQAAADNVDVIADDITLGKVEIKASDTPLQQEKADLQKAILSLSDDPFALVDDTTETADRIIDALEKAAATTTNARDLFDFYVSIFAVGDDEPAVSETTSTRKKQAKNQAAIFDLTKSIAIAEAGKAASKIDFESETDAKDTKKTITDAIDGITSTTTNNFVYRDLKNLRATLSLLITQGENVLPRVIAFTPVKTLPELVISYSLYEDALVDIATRNNIPHPGFIPGGSVLEVLSNV
jgi:prophage DNA circulation protein